MTGGGIGRGVYCLVLANKCSRVRIGALGVIDFPEGWHVYIGSALGPGGLRRISRHFRLFLSGSGKKHWHIDYLLTCSDFSLRYAVSSRTPDRLECEVAGMIGGEPVPRFGCSDCHCLSHLFYFVTDPFDRIAGCLDALGLVPDIATINTVER